MAIRLPAIMHAMQILRRSNLLPNQSASYDVPKGYIAVYVGESEKKRFIIPISAFFSRVTLYGRGRIWVSPSDGWSNNSLQGRRSQQAYLSPGWILNGYRKL